jgi:hypothetical protein
MSDPRARWWRATRSSLSRVLYERDPDGMGSSVMGPEDEYDDLAVRLFRALLDMPEEGGASGAVRGIWPDADDQMVEEIERVWTDAILARGDRDR